MTYYERVKLLRDNQQRLLDEFLAEVVLSGLITKIELTKENIDRVYFQFRHNQFNRFSAISWKENIQNLKNEFNETGKELYNEMITEVQYNIRFWDIARHLFQADRKLEQIKYFASKK